MVLDEIYATTFVTLRSDTGPEGPVFLRTVKGTARGRWGPQIRRIVSARALLQGSGQGVLQALPVPGGVKSPRFSRRKKHAPGKLH